LRYTSAINGFDSIVITKLDVLDVFDRIAVCVGYKLNGKILDSVPPTVAELGALEPVYEYRPGWCSSTFGLSDYDALPAKAHEYLAYLEQQTGVEIGCISTGPERNQTIVRPGSRLAKLLG
jgi:adenylosuccinate synthase